MRGATGAALRVAVVVALLGVEVARAQPAPPPTTRQLTARIAALERRVAKLEAQIATLQANRALALGPYVSVEPNPVNGLRGPNVFLTGVNVHVRSGSGATSVGASSSGGALTGLGNLVVGYNEPDPSPEADRSGSHNLIVGAEHEYSSFGGFLAGYRNELRGRYCSVSGGFENEADADYTSLAGGANNSTRGSFSAVSGGYGNSAWGEYASAGGGRYNRASGPYASVGGGSENDASGEASSVSGGSRRSTEGLHDWAAGALVEAE